MTDWCPKCGSFNVKRWEFGKIFCHACGWKQGRLVQTLNERMLRLKKMGLLGNVRTQHTVGL